MALGFVSRMLGGVFGFLKVVVIFSIILSLTKEYKLIKKETQKQSVLITPLQEITDIIMPELNKQKDIIIDVAEERTQKAKEALDKKINPEE